MFMAPLPNGLTCSFLRTASRRSTKKYMAGPGKIIRPKRGTRIDGRYLSPCHEKAEVLRTRTEEQL